MGIGKKMTKGMMGGGVNISHKETMGGKAKSLMSYPGGMPGKQDSNGVVGKGMMEYLDGQPVGIGKYKHNSMPMYGKEKGMPDYSKGPEKELIGNQNRLPEYLKEKIEAAPPKSKGPAQEPDISNEGFQEGDYYQPKTATVGIMNFNGDEKDEEKDPIIKNFIDKSESQKRLDKARSTRRTQRRSKRAKNQARRKNKRASRIESKNETRFFDL